MPDGLPRALRMDDGQLSEVVPSDLFYDQTRCSQCEHPRRRGGIANGETWINYAVSAG